MSEIVNVNPSQALDGILGRPTDGPTEDRVDQQALGQGDFFKLLTTQLASQDPLSPMEDTAFIAQMAQFSALEMQSQLNTNFGDFTSSQQFQSAQGMIGNKVTMLIDGEEVSGIAEGIESVDGITRVFVDGRGYNMDAVFKIEAPKPVEKENGSKSDASGGGSTGQDQSPEDSASDSVVTTSRQLAAVAAN